MITKTLNYLSTQIKNIGLWYHMEYKDRAHSKYFLQTHVMFMSSSVPFDKEEWSN